MLSAWWMCVWFILDRIFVRTYNCLRNVNSTIFKSFNDILLITAPMTQTRGKGSEWVPFFFYMHRSEQGIRTVCLRDTLLAPAECWPSFIQTRYMGYMELWWANPPLDDSCTFNIYKTRRALSPQLALRATSIIDLINYVADCILLRSASFVVSTAVMNLQTRSHFASRVGAYCSMKNNDECIILTRPNI